jgi:hypothetical protein
MSLWHLYNYANRGTDVFRTGCIAYIPVGLHLAPAVSVYSCYFLACGFFSKNINASPCVYLRVPGGLEQPGNSGQHGPSPKPR